jgi:antitoxin ChpS
MHRTNLRRVGGSVMLAVPRALLEVLGLQPGTEVGLGVEKGRLVVQPQQRPRYTLQELLSQSNQKVRRSKKDREWLNDKPVGRELL